MLGVEVALAVDEVALFVWEVVLAVDEVAVIVLVASDCRDTKRKFYIN